MVAPAVASSNVSWSGYRRACSCSRSAAGSGSGTAGKVMADEEPRLHVLLASPDACRLVASVLAVVEQEAGYAAARDVTLRNLLGVPRRR